MELGIRLIGVSAVAAVIVAIMWVGYLLYDKEPKLSVVLLIVGLVLAIGFIVSELNYKHKRLELEASGYLRVHISRKSNINKNIALSTQ